jgi:hypothetical protein
VLAVDGDPLDDIAVLAEPEAHLDLIVRGGEIVHDALTT